MMHDPSGLGGAGASGGYCMPPYAGYPMPGPHGAYGAPVPGAGYPPAGYYYGAAGPAPGGSAPSAGYPGMPPAGGAGGGGYMGGGYSAPAPAAGSGESADTGRATGGGGGGGNRRPGDWDCPSCGRMCFAYRAECRCGARKPASAGGY